MLVAPGVLARECDARGGPFFAFQALEHRHRGVELVGGLVAGGGRRRDGRPRGGEEAAPPFLRRCDASEVVVVAPGPCVRAVVERLVEEGPAGVDQDTFLSGVGLTLGPRTLPRLRRRRCSRAAFVEEADALISGALAAVVAVAEDVDHGGGWRSLAAFPWRLRRGCS